MGEAPEDGQVSAGGGDKDAGSPTCWMATGCEDHRAVQVEEGGDKTVSAWRRGWAGDGAGSGGPGVLGIRHDASACL
jgi:hypothetical protein